MTERENNMENFLGLNEYPSSSSDDENNVPGPTATQGWHQQPSNQALPSQNNEVINVDESPSPEVSPPGEEVVESASLPSTADQRREQARLDHRSFWSAVGSPHRNWFGLNTPARFAPRFADESGSGEHEARPALFGQRANDRLSPVPETRSQGMEPRSVVHEPVPELREPQMPQSASADILSIMAFRRLQRYRTYRRNRVATLGLLSRVQPPEQSRESSPRTSGRVSRTSSVPVPYERLLSSMMAMREAEHARARSAAPAPERPQEDGVEQNDAEDNDNEQSGDEAEIIRLSPRLSVPDEEQQDNPDNMQVDEPRAASPQEEEGGDGEEESEEETAAAASPAPSAGNGNTSNDPGNASGRLFVDIRRRSRGHKRRRDSERQRTEAFNVKEFNQNLLRLLECPVCLEWMEPPMLQCRLGHLVCARCRARLSTCPVCRSGFSSVRNRAMEGVAELLRYPCRHGCGREARLRRRAAHEASCPRRRYRCPAVTCAERAPQPYDELVRHVQRNHAAMIKTGRLHKFSVRVNAQQHDNWLIMAGFGLFHLRIAVDIRTWSIVAYVAYIGPKCRAKEFTYEVTIVGQHNGRKLVYTRATHSDLESSSLNLSRQDCFHVTLDEAVNFLRIRNRHCQPDRLLDFTVQITKQEVIPDNNSTISDD